MAENEISDSPLIRALSEYFQKQGRIVSDNILKILEKSPLELTIEEQREFEDIILPSWNLIKEALKAQLALAYHERNLWEACMGKNPHVIISKIAEEALIDFEKDQILEAQQSPQPVSQKAVEAERMPLHKAIIHKAVVISVVSVSIVLLAAGSVNVYKIIQKGRLGGSDKEQILKIVNLWLNRGRENPKPDHDLEMEMLWSSLAPDSPIKSKVDSMIKSDQDTRIKFFFYYEDFFLIPVESSSIDEIKKREDDVIVKCTCVFQEFYDEVYQERTPRTTVKFEYKFKKYSEGWRLYDYTEEEI